MNISSVYYRSARSRQRGSTLLVALVMLVLLTLIAISAMNSSTSSIHIVGNAQFRAEANAVGQQAIEQVISNKNFMTVAPATQLIDVNGDGSADYSVAFSPRPACFSFVVTKPTDPGVSDECLSSGTFAACYWTVWDVVAVVTDLNSSNTAPVMVHQGVRSIAGRKAAENSCM